MTVRGRHVPFLGLAAAALLGASLAACGGPTPGGDDPRDTVPIPPAQPLDVTVVADDALAVTQTVPTDGGTLSVTVADGTQYRLTVPATALLADTTITMTPLSSVDGAPLAGAARGVALEPDGLRLYDTATLEIVPPAGAGEHVAGFGTLGGGQEFHLQPLVPGEGVRLSLMHFSEHGAFFSEVGPILVEDPVEFMPADWESGLNQMLAELLQTEREAQLAGLPGDPDLDRKLEAVLRTYFQKVVQPMLQQIRLDCAYAKENASKVLGWNRAVALVGKEDVFSAETAEVLGAVVEGAENCWREATEPCVNQADPVRFPEVLAAARLNQLLGGDPSVYDPYDPELACEPEWTGTITLTRESAIHDAYHEETPCCDGRVKTTDGTLDFVTTTNETWTVTGAGLAYSYTAQFEGEVDFDRSAHTVIASWLNCGEDWQAHESVTTTTESGSATGSGSTVVYVQVADDGSYQVNAQPPNIETTGMQSYESTSRTGPDCVGEYEDGSSTYTEAYSPDLFAAYGHGTVDPEDPGVLSGSETTVEDDGYTVVTTTVTWELRRAGGQ